MTNAKRKVRFILNPFSGVKRNDVIKQTIHDNVDIQQFDYEIIETEYPGHATEIARDAVQKNYDIVVAVGGDGSVNEVAAALVGTNVPMGVLPAGSGNGFAMYIGYGRDVARAVCLFNRGIVKKIDVCFINEQPYVNLAGLGFDAAIAYKYQRTKKRGFMGYLKFSLREAFTYQFQKHTINIDGKYYERELLSITIANGPMYGYNFIIAPNAQLDNGKLEVVLVKKAPKWRYFLVIWRMLNKTLHRSSLVECIAANKVEIYCDPSQKVFAHIDGEGFPVSGKLVFQIVPASLNVIMPS